MSDDQTGKSRLPCEDLREQATWLERHRTSEKDQPETKGEYIRNQEPTSQGSCWTFPTKSALLPNKEAIMDMTRIMKAVLKVLLILPLIFWGVGRVEAVRVPQGMNTIRWGYMTNYPGLDQYVALASSSIELLGIKPDGTVDGFLLRDQTQAVLPSLTNVFDIAFTEEGGGVALLKDGSIRAWGRAGTEESSGRLVAFPDKLTNVIAVCAEINFRVGVVTADGHVYCAGSQGGDLECVVPSGATNIVQAAMNSGNGVALRANGTVIGWGMRSGGVRNIPASQSNVVEVAASLNGTYLLLNDGRVQRYWFDAPNGEWIPGVTNAISISANTWNQVALLADGGVQSLGVPSWQQPRPVPSWVRGAVKLFAASDGGIVFSKAPLLLDGEDQPVHDNLLLSIGTNYVLKAKYSRNPNAAFRWMRGNVELPGLNGPTLTLTNLQPSDSGVYRVTTEESGEQLSSQTLELVIGLPHFTSQPGDIQMETGYPTNLTATVEASAPVDYQWLVDGEPFTVWNSSSHVFPDDAVALNSPILALPPALAGVTANFQVIAATAFGSVTSRVALVTFTLAPTAVAEGLGEGAGVGLRDVNAVREIAQTFTPSESGHLDRIHVDGTFSDASEEYPTIFTITDTVAGKPGTNILGRSIARHLPGSLLVNFNNEGVYISSNKTYALVIRTDAKSTTSMTYFFRAAGENPYPGGQLFVRTPPGLWGKNFGYGQVNPDLLFGVYIFPDWPLIRLTKPGANFVMVAGTTVHVEAQLAPGFDASGGVGFFANGTSIGTVLEPPFALDWSPSEVGAISLEARTHNLSNNEEISSTPIGGVAVDHRPDNDDFAAARVLSGEGGRTALVLDGATSERGEPKVRPEDLGTSIWYRWKAQRTASMILATWPLNTNITLGVFEGSLIEGLLNRRTGDGYVGFEARAGTEYFIQADARVIDNGTNSLTFAQDDLRIISPSSQQVFTSPASVTVWVVRQSLQRAITNITVKLDGNAVISSNANSFTSGLVIEVPGTHSLEFAETDDLGVTTVSSPLTVVVRPANDSFASAIPIEGQHLSFTTSNAGATTEKTPKPGQTDGFGEPRFADNVGGHSIWYRWTAPADGVCLLGSHGTVGDVFTAAFVGTNPIELSEVGSDALSNPDQPTVFNARAGTNYVILVDVRDSEPGPLIWTLDLQAKNDLFSTRSAITPTEYEEIVLLEGGAIEANEQGLAPSGADASWWWSWKAPINGRLRLSAEATGGSLGLRVFSGTRLTRLQLVAGSGGMDGKASVEFPAKAGEVYQIALYSTSAASGFARLRLSLESLRIISPFSGASLKFGNPIPVETRFDVEADPARRVTLRANGVEVASRTNAPFNFSWTPVEPGSYLLEAVADGESGTQFGSLPVRLLLYEGENIPKPWLVGSISLKGGIFVDAIGTMHPVGKFATLLGLTNEPADLSSVIPAGSGGYRLARPEIIDLNFLYGGPGVSPVTEAKAGIWGLSADGHLIANGSDVQPFPPGVSRFTDLTGGGGIFVATGNNGKLYGNGKTVPLQLPADRKWTTATFGLQYFAARTEDGRAFSFGRGLFGELAETEILPLNGATKWITMKGNAEDLFLIDNRNELYRLGYQEPLPIRINRPSGVSSWTKLTLGSQHGLAMADTGVLYGFGRNSEGQLGNGRGNEFNFVARPVIQPPGVTAWIDFACGFQMSMAIGNDCSLYTWGYNGEGELGFAASAPVRQPTRVTAFEGVCGDMIVFSRNPDTHQIENGFKIAFPSIFNRRYIIQYTDDLAVWKTAFPPVTGTGGNVEWIDNGPPTTETAPASSAVRMYRIGFAP